MNEQKIKEEFSTILNLADNMAAAAAAFNAHGYDTFIQARDYLKDYLNSVSMKLAS